MSELTIRSERVELRQLRPWLNVRAPHLDASVIGCIELCVHELATNVIDHSAAPELSIRWTIDTSHVTVELRDEGEALPRTTLTDREPHPRVRGYGMMIAEQLASELIYERQGSLNVWQARFDLG